jgi:hypothetical protein
MTIPFYQADAFTDHLFGGNFRKSGDLPDRNY